MTDKKPLILIVDDLPDNIELLGEILSPDFEIKFALDGSKALQIATSSEPPELILLDIMMPGKDGYQVCRELKLDRRTAGIPVIFVSALNEEVDEARGFEAGGVDYVSKPVSPLLVRSRVMTHVKLAQAVRHLERQNEILSENVRLREDVERVTRHDLKGPLAAFINIPQMLAREKNISPDQAEMLGILAKSGNRMLEMINRSLDLAKMERGQYQLHPVPVDLVPVVNQIFQELAGHPALEKKSWAVSLNQKPAAPGSSFPVPGEEYLFFCMLSNLIKNAFEASPDGSRVEVSLLDTPEKTIVVRNPGVIPPQVRDRFFERYATFGKEGGTGLGAYSARLMARTMGGRISFTTTEADGTAIMVEFPKDAPRAAVTPLSAGLTEGPETATAREAPKGRTRDAMNVLVADGNPLIRRLIAGVIREMGMSSILEVGNGVEAITLLEKISFDLVIADKATATRSGLEILAFMRGRETHRHTPFILAAAQLTRAEAIEAVEKGARECLVKPFSPDVLRQKIEKVLGK